MKLKSGRDEIVYLLTKVVEKYELTTGQEIVRNTNRKNYEDLARLLSEISNELPGTAETLDHDHYSPDPNPSRLKYPYRKYDITGGQIKDAYVGIVANPRPFLVDACYIYLYGMGRKGFEKNPQNTNLLKDSEQSDTNKLDILKQEYETFKHQILNQQQEKEEILYRTGKTYKEKTRTLLVIIVIILGALFFVAREWIGTRNKWQTIKKDMKILPYKPTQAEIDSVEGIWLCYTGSPQARGSNANRYHMVVSNVVDVKYKDIYFTFKRYGASFDHAGYMQFEAPYLVSIHSYVMNNTDSIESPRHSLMRLDAEKPYVSAISASWNFDIGNKNNIIGIREVYIKQGKGGSVEEVINTIENASCQCKIIRWHQEQDKVKTFYLKNLFLDTLKDESIRNLLDEKSIILRVPQEGLIISDTTGTHK